MGKRIYLNILYSYYKDLFTDKQQIYFEDYYYNNLSLGEIAENNGISRNAVHNQLKIVENRLYELENILKMYETKKKVIKLLTDTVDKDILKQLDELL